MEETVEAEIAEPEPAVRFFQLAAVVFPQRECGMAAPHAEFPVFAVIDDLLGQIKGKVHDMFSCTNFCLL